MSYLDVAMLMYYFERACFSVAADNTVDDAVERLVSMDLSNTGYELLTTDGGYPIGVTIDKSDGSQERIIFSSWKAELIAEQPSNIENYLKNYKDNVAAYAINSNNSAIQEEIINMLEYKEPHFADIIQNEGGLTFADFLDDEIIKSLIIFVAENVVAELLGPIGVLDLFGISSQLITDKIHDKVQELYLLGEFDDAITNTLEGKSGDDEMAGGHEADTIIGGNGRNVIRGFGGDDTIFVHSELPMYGDGITPNATGVVEGGSGADNIRGFSGNDIIFGDNYIFNDMAFNTLTYAQLKAYIEENYDPNNPSELYDAINNETFGADAATNDTIRGDSNTVDYYGNSTAGNDIIFGGEGNDIIYGDATDIKSLPGGNDMIFGGAGADELYGHNGSDTVYGGKDGDFIYGGNGADKLYGEEGDDRLYANDAIRDSDGNIIFDTDWLTGIASERGHVDDGADHILIGGRGNDILFGSDGDDILVGADVRTNADGATYIQDDFGADGMDTGYDDLHGGDGYDVFYVGNGDFVYDSDGEGRVIFNGIELKGGLFSHSLKTGGEWVDYYYSHDGIEYMATSYGTIVTLLDNSRIYLKDLTMSLWSLEHEHLGVTLTDGGSNPSLRPNFGSIMDPRLGKTSSEDLALAGDTSANTIAGSDGNDTLTGGKGNDRLYGDNGNDIYVFNQGDGVDTINDAGGTDTILFNGLDTSDNFGFFESGNDMYLSYGEGDSIRITNNNIERIELDNGYYLTDSDMNFIIQQMSAFSKDNGVNFTSADDVRKNDYMQTVIASTWREF